VRENDNQRWIGRWTKQDWEKYSDLLA